jgi:hypothetical protein
MVNNTIIMISFGVGHFGARVAVVRIRWAAQVAKIIEEVAAFSASTHAYISLLFGTNRAAAHARGAHRNSVVGAVAVVAGSIDVGVVFGAAEALEGVEAGVAIERAAETLLAEEIGVEG